MIIVLLLGVPFLVNFYFSYHFFDTHQLIDLHLEIFILFVPLELVLLFLRKTTTDTLTTVLIKLKRIYDEISPGIVLVRNIEEDRSLFEFTGNLPRYEVDGMYISLRGHAGGVEENVFAVAEGLDKELQKFMDIIAFGLEEFRVDDETDYLLEHAVHDVVPPVLREAPLRPNPRTCTASRIYTRDTYRRTSGAVSP
jgi:hypothetical protein